MFLSLVLLESVILINGTDIDLFKGSGVQNRLLDVDAGPSIWL